MKLDVEPEIANLTWRGKRYYECTQDDADELRYQAGEARTEAEKLKAILVEEETEKIIAENKQIIKRQTRTFDTEIAEANKEIRRVDQEIDEFLQEYASHLLEELEFWKEERTRLRKQKAEWLDESNGIQAGNISSMLSVNEAIEKNEHSAEQKFRFARAIEQHLTNRAMEEAESKKV